MKAIKDLKEVLPHFNDSKEESAETYLSKLKYYFEKNYVSESLFMEALSSTLLGILGDW